MYNLKALVLVNDMYWKTVEYSTYRFIRKPELYENEVASEIQKVRKDVAVQKKNEALNEKDSISLINFLPISKRAWDSSKVQKVAAVCLYRKFMMDPSLPPP